MLTRNIKVGALQRYFAYYPNNPVKIHILLFGIEHRNVVYSYLPQSGKKRHVVMMINASLMASVADYLPRQLGILHN
jgi:hypothetical protein